MQRISDSALPAGANVTAQYAWSAVEDPHGMFTPGASGVAATITAPVDGVYFVHFHAAAMGATSGYHAVKVMLNGTDESTHSVATDLALFPSGGADGAVVDALRPRLPLARGDRLHWSQFSSVAATAVSSALGVPTEVVVHYVGAG